MGERLRELRVRVPIAHQSVKPLIDALLVNSRDAIITINADGTICYLSAGATLLLGYDAETSVGTSVLAYVHPDDVELAAGLLQRRLDWDGVALSHQWTVRHSIGEWVSVGVTVSLLPTGGLGVASLTLRAEDGEITRESSLRRQLIVEQFCNRLGAEFMEVAASAGVPQLVQRSVEDVGLLANAELVAVHLERPERDVVERIALWSHHTFPDAGFDVVEMEEHRDAVERLLSETFVADDLGAPQNAPVAGLLANSPAASILSAPISAKGARGVLLLARQATLHPWTEADVQLVRGVAKVYGRALDVARAEELMALTYSQGPIGFSIRNADGTLVDCNQRYLELWGLTREQADDMNLSELVDPENWALFQLETARLRSGDATRILRDVLAIEAPLGPKWFRVSAVELNAGDSHEPLVLSSIEDVTEVHEQRSKLEWAAEHDSLTGVANRLAMLQRIDECQLETGVLPHLLFTDLDRFKLINDSLGHSVGDQVLVEVGRRISEQVGERGLVARLGGDEFAVVVDDDLDEQHVRDLAERLRRAFGRPLDIGGRLTTQTISIGVAIGHECANPTELLARADRAMYAAKALGRNRYVVFDASMRDEGLARVAIERELRYAIDHGELEVHFQPEFALDDLRILGAEALMRWRHPERGLLPAAYFIDVAEQSGLIDDIGRFALHEACRSFAEITTGAHDSSLVLRVNISGREFSRPELSDLVRTALADSGLPPERLCLEMTETTLMDAPYVVLETFERLHEIGVEFAIDDFGTGYSSLSYLKRYPVDALKIDRSFVGDIDSDADSRAIVESIVGLGRALSLPLIAEGIETEQQLDILRTLGCESGQGFLVSPAVPAERLAEMLQA